MRISVPVVGRHHVLRELDAEPAKLLRWASVIRINFELLLEDLDFIIDVLRFNEASIASVSGLAHLASILFLLYSSMKAEASLKALENAGS